MTLNNASVGGSEPNEQPRPCGTRRASPASRCSWDLSRRLLVPSAPKCRCSPRGTAPLASALVARNSARRQGSCSTRPVTVDPPRHYVSFCLVGARRSQTGGDPAAPGWVAGRAQPRQVGGRAPAPCTALQSPSGSSRVAPCSKSRGS